MNPVNRALDEIISQVEALPPDQRRLLMRQLKAMGLLQPEELSSDRNPLPLALSVPRPGLAAQDDRARSAMPEHAPPRPAVRPQPGHSRSSGSGHAGGAHQAQDEAPTAMPPRPGQPPAEPVRIVFDGGSRGNPGQGYGSFALDWPGQPRQIVRLNFGDRTTNNEAEYDTLIAGLECVRKRLVDHEIDPASVTLSIWGDSQLVCSQVRGDWRCKEPRLRLRLNKARALLSEFGGATVNHHPREKSVEILGH